MKFSISGEIFEKYPNAIIGAMAVNGTDNAGEDAEINELLRQEEGKIRSGFALENLAQHPMVQNWRKAYKMFGSDDRCSSEALIRRVLKGGEIPHINKLVDIYNFISLKYRTPVGGEDLDKMSGGIFLKLAEGSEKFVVLGGSESETAEKGEVVYCDGREVLCRKWNWRESENTKLTEGTKNAFLVIDALPPVDARAVRNALEEFSSLAKAHCGARARIFMLSSENRAIEF